MSPARVGLVVNPVAGMGGAVALHGTDAAVAEAIRRGARPIAGTYAARAVRGLLAACRSTQIVSAPGPMGGASVVAAGGVPVLVGDEPPEPTAGKDSTEIAKRVIAAGVDLLLFAGGDGTARDVLDAVGDRVPVLGIPTGVKMQSGVFATSPEAAGHCAAAFLAPGGSVRLRDGEVMDLDEAARGRGILSGRLYGVLKVPAERRLMQSAKSGPAARPDDDVLAACRTLARTMRPDTLYLIGPGATTLELERMLGLDGSLLGVDAAMEGGLLGRDLSEAEIARMMDGRRVELILGVPGGQGCLLGRGNQPLGPSILATIPRENITVLAAADKLLALRPCRLFVDTGDVAEDARLAGFWRITTGPGRTMMMRVAC